MSEHHQVVAEHMAADPNMADLTTAERELVAYALDGAAETIAAMLARVRTLCDASTDGTVSVDALKRAIAGEPQ